LKEIFNEHYKFIGDLITNEKMLENIICEFTINTYDTRTMEVKVTPTQGSFLFVFESVKLRAPILIKSKRMRNEIILDVGMPSLEINSKTGHTATFIVYQCTFNNYYKDELIPNKIHCSAMIPHSAIFERRRAITNHYAKGILAGWRERKEREKVFDSWENEEYSYKTDIGFLKIIPSFIFGEFAIEENHEKAKFLVDQTYLSLVVKKNSLINFNIENKFVKNLNDFLKILSFLEGESLDWRSMNIHYSLSNRKLKETKIFNKSNEMYDANKNKNYYRMNRITYGNIITELFLSLQKQDVNTYNEVTRVIDRFLIASTQMVEDTQLIYWHSCLDIIIKYFNSIGKSFSHKLIDCCKKNNVEWLDLFPTVTSESLDNKNEFPINKIRNDMIHYGIYPKDSELIFTEMYKTRALCERLICKMLKVNYKNKGLGFPQF
jgi:predicted RNA-binding protein with RPS1 domain